MIRKLLPVLKIEFNSSPATLAVFPFFHCYKVVYPILTVLYLLCVYSHKLDITD